MSLSNYEKAKGLGQFATASAIEEINRRLDEYEKRVEENEKLLKEIKKQLKVTDNKE